MEEHYVEKRPWGMFEILSQFSVGDDSDVCVKKVIVNPNGRLSYQSHKQRTEHWTFVKGKGIVMLDDEEYKVFPGATITIPVGSRHRVINDSSDEVVFIEVSEGHFDENDIIRYQDEYGRL